MTNIELSTDLSGLRKQLRSLDREITFLRHETNRFRQMGFGRDFKDLQLMALEEDRYALLRAITDLQGPIRKSRRTNRQNLDLALIPVAMVLIAVNEVKSKISRGFAIGPTLGRRSIHDKAF